MSDKNKIGKLEDIKGTAVQSTPIEQLPLSERIKIAETTDHYKGIAAGWFIDARDSVNNWCIGQVLKVEGNFVYVNYDGWSSKYDDTLKLWSFKTCPFRLYSKGYTGQLKVPLRNKMSFTLEGLADHKRKLEQVLETKFKCLTSAFEITQYLRGQLFIYVDFLMANEYNDPVKEIPYVVEFLNLVAKMIASWLSLFPNYLPSFIEWQANTKLMLVDRNVAFAACGNEILDMLKFIFCLCHRSLVFFERYDIAATNNEIMHTKDFNIKFEEKRDKDPNVLLLMDRIENDEPMIYGLFINLFNTFCNAGGLSAIYDILSPEILLKKANMTTGYKLPLDVVAMLLAPLKSIKAIAKDEIVKEIVSIGEKAFFQRLQTLDEKEIKDINKESIPVALSLMKGILKLEYSDERASKIIETHEMMLSLKLLQSPFLEKRLNGLADIRKMIDKMELPQIISQQKPSSGFNSEYLAEWIIKNNILGIILNENAHAELVKRTSYILIFLAKKKLISKDIIELLWKCQQDKHEDIIRVVYNTVGEIVDYLSIDEIKFAFSKIKGVPLEFCDEKLVGFMKEFTIKAYNVQEKSKSFMDIKNFEIPQISLEGEYTNTGELTIPSDDELYFLPTFWKLMQDDAPVSTAITEQAALAIRPILNNPHCLKVRIQYLYLCLQNIKQKKSIQQSIALAHIMFLTFNNQKESYGKTLQDLFKEINKKDPLIDLILSSCEYYNKEVGEKIKQTKIQGEIGDAIFMGRYKHSQNLMTRLNFLKFILHLGGIAMKFTNENILKLWNIFTIDCSLENDTQEFLKWLSIERENTPDLLPISIFGKEENVYLFKIISQSREFLAKNLGISFYKCFAKHFKLINLEDNVVEIKRGRVKAINIGMIIGLDDLWENVGYNHQDQTRVKFCELLIDLYLNVSEILQPRKSEICKTFVDRCMSIIMNADYEKEQIKIANIVKLLILFIDIMDGKKYNSNEVSTQHQNLYTIMANMKSTNTDKKLEVLVDVSLGQIRKKVAEAFHIPFSGFQMRGPVRTYEPEDDDSLFRNIGWSQNLFIELFPGQKDESIKTLLAHNITYINHLFVLLTKENTAYVDTVWELLSILPSNEKILAEIKALNVTDSSPEAWNNLLDATSTHKMLYSLQIIDRIVIPQEGESPDAISNRKNWIEDFCKKGGITHIYYALTNLSLNSVQHPLSRACFQLILKLLTIFQSHGCSSYLANQPKTCERILLLLEAFAHYSMMSEDAKSQKNAGKKGKILVNKKEDDDARKNAEAETLLRQKKKQAEETKAFEHGLKLLQENCVNPQLCFEQMVKCEKFHDLLIKGLLLSDNTLLQSVFAKEIIEICKLSISTPNIPNPPHIILLPLMAQGMVKITLEKDCKCQEFYSALCEIIKYLSHEELLAVPVNYNALLTNLSNNVKEHEIKESQSTDTDDVLIGLLKLLEALLSKFYNLREFVGQKCGMVSEVLHNCLFEFPKLGKSNGKFPPKCKSQLSRQAAFSLLVILARDTPKNLNDIINFLYPIHANGSWRTKKLSDWNITLDTSEKSTTGYVGIKNLACICYMNSLLQQFYMIPSFRNDILATNDPHKNVNPDDNLLFQLQCLFSALNQSVKQSYNPKIFCHAFKDWDGKSINVMEQMDVDEFFNLFLDKIETVIKGTPQAKTIAHHFGGVYANQLICKDCPHSSIRDEPFLAINLQIKNKKSLQQCMESFVEGEMLQGNNAYHCEKCDKKVTTLKRVCIKKLPRYLIFVLKRFDINYDTMQKYKVNDFCEFPMKLNMENYSMEGLAKKDKEKEKEKAMKEGREVEEENSVPVQPSKQYPQEYYDYKLTGIVIHMGTAEGGHYYSLIMDREKSNMPEKERWFEFNDSKVESYDPDEIKNDAFGGEERYSSFEGNGIKIVEKIRNAYMLVYERITPYDIPEEEEEGDKSKEKPENKMVGMKGEAKIPEEIYKAIQAENVKYWYNKFMFHDDYFVFARNLLLTWNSVNNILKTSPSKNCDYHLYNINEEAKKIHQFQTDLTKKMIGLETDVNPQANVKLLDIYDIMIFRYAATLLLTTVFRVRNEKMLADLIDITKAYINKHQVAAKWFIHQFTNSQVIREFLFECPELDLCRFTTGLLYCAMLKVYDEEKAKIGANSACFLPQFANCLMCQLSGCRKYTKNFAYYFQAIARLANLGPEMREYLLKNDSIERLLGFWKSIDETNWNDFTGIKYNENKKVDIGLSTEVDERFQSPFEEFFTQKREQNCQNANPVYTFLFEALSLLIRSATFKESPIKSPLTLPQVGIMNPKLRSLLLSPNIIGELMNNCVDNLASEMVVSIFQYLAWENMEFKQAFLQGLTKEMNEAQFANLKKMFKFVDEMLKVEDSEQSAFIGIALGVVNTVMKNNQNAFYDTCMSIEYLANTNIQNKKIFEWYAKNPEVWSWIIDWLKKNCDPSSKFDIDGVKPFKSQEQNANYFKEAKYGIGLEPENQWKEYMKNFIERLEHLNEGKMQNIEFRTGTSGTTYNKKFFVNQVLEQCDQKSKGWNRVTVLRVLDEMLYVCPEGLSEKYGMWIETESEYLALEGTNLKPKPAKKEAEDEDFQMDNDSDDDMKFYT